MTAATPQPLQYAATSTRVASGVSWEYRLALFCGLGPTIMGTVALVGWLVSHYGGFEAVGMLTVVGGIGLLPIGLIAAVVHLWMSRRRRNELGPRWFVPGAVAIVILIGNVPLSAAYFSVYRSIASRYTVRVTNATPGTITGIVISDPIGKQLKFATVPPGQTVQGWFRPGGEGAITLSASTLAQPVEVDGYYSDGMPSGPVTRTVTFGRNGAVTVQ